MHNKFSVSASKFHHLAWYAVLALSLAACGGADDPSSTAAQSSATTSAAIQPFILNGVPQSFVEAGTLYRYMPSASGSNGRALSYDIVNKPDWATFVEASGELSGTPDASNVGTTGEIEIGVSDGTTRATVGPFQIRVIAPESPATPSTPSTPSAPSAPATIAGTPSSTVTAGQPYSFNPVVTDLSGAALSFSIVNRPAWTTFNTATGALSGTPNTANVGTFTHIVISVSTDAAPISLPTFSIKVQAATDSTPTISGTPVTKVAAGGSYSLTPVVGDPDGNALTFSILNAPSWANFNTSTGELSGSPPASAAGSVFSNVVISVSDGTATASLAAFSITVGSGAPTTTGNVFPQIGVIANLGNQTFASTYDASLAQYGLIILGGNFPSWPQSQGRTRDQTVVSLKSQTHTGRNALTPLVFQYENANEMNLSSPWFPEWTTAVTNNNWFVYESGSSGTMSQSAYNASYVLANQDHVVGTDPSTGLYPYGLLADLLYQRYYLGTGSGGTAMASTHLDGYLVDNMTQRNLAGDAADWERNGSDPSSTDPTATAAVTLGKADYITQLAVLNPDIIAGGNSEFGYDMSPASAGALGMTFSNLSGKLGLALQEFEWATAGGQNNVLNFGGFAGAMTWYQTLENNTKSDGYAVMAGGVLSTDYQLVRYSLGLTLMRNGWAVYAINSTGNDVIDPGNSATYPVFDEFWGGTLNTAGYLGNAASTALGAEQTGPWLQGVWRRDFVNGIVLVNPNTNGSQTVALGGTFWHLNGSQAPSINNGAAVTSVTIPAGDGLILLRSAPH